MPNYRKRLQNLFVKEIPIVDDVYIISEDSLNNNQSQTNNVFSDKWSEFDREDIINQEKTFNFQKKWYLSLYGFSNESELKEYLKTKDVILDAGCGLGYKAKWFAELSPKSLILGIDYSDSVFLARKKYQQIENLFFLKGDIANTKLNDRSINFVSCDQVIHHTENPEKTLSELTRILKLEEDIALYVYAKKALPRELLDDHFRGLSKKVSNEEMWEFSKQVTALGKTLSELNIKIDVPDMPLLDIKGGKLDLQRFIYWNFIKCFWNDELGLETSISTNYDWYAPSNAERYTKDEFLSMISKCNLEITFLHGEEACHSRRFKKN